MGKSSSAFHRALIISFFLVLSPIVLSTVVEATANHHDWKWMNPAKQGECRGTIGECMGAAGDQGEFDMDSESNRRMLAAVKYIGYGALKGDFVPCSIKGKSYYNCQEGGQANPYTRGCNAISKCRTD